MFRLRSELCSPRLIHIAHRGLILGSLRGDYAASGGGRAWADNRRALPLMNLLEVTKLVKSYNGRIVVNEVSFVLAQEEIVGLLGRNGAGKTTTFRMILGMVTPDSGAVAFDARDITQLPMYKRARLGIGYLSQEQSIFRQLTVWQNLQAILETLNITRAERKKRG